jgi:hypothetical protein
LLVLWYDVVVYTIKALAHLHIQSVVVYIRCLGWPQQCRQHLSQHLFAQLWRVWGVRHSSSLEIDMLGPYTQRLLLLLLLLVPAACYIAGGGQAAASYIFNAA